MAGLTRATWSCNPFLMDVSIPPGQREAALAAIVRHNPPAWVPDLAAMCGLTGDTTA